MKLAVWWLILMGYSQKQKQLYLYHHRIYGHQTWEVGDLPWGVPIHRVAQSFGNVAVYLHYRSAFGHRTWQVGDLPWGISTHKVKWPSDEVFLQDHIANYKYCISTNTVPNATKLGRMVTYHKGIPPILSHDSSVIWPCEVTWQIKCFTSLHALDQLTPSKMSHNPLNTWPLEVTWQIRSVISPFEVDLWQSN